MKKIKNKLIYTFILTTLAIPSFIYADWIVESQLVPCNPKIQPDGTMTKCGFYDLVALVNNIIDFIIYISIPISAVMFAFAGALYISGKSSNIERAHGIFKNVGRGLVFVLGAWLIVKAILSGMGAEGGGVINLIG